MLQRLLFFELEKVAEHWNAACMVPNAFVFVFSCCLPFSGENHFVCRVKGIFWQLNSNTRKKIYWRRKVKEERDDKTITLILIKRNAIERETKTNCRHIALLGFFLASFHICNICVFFWNVFLLFVFYVMPNHKTVHWALSIMCAHRYEMHGDLHLLGGSRRIPSWKCKKT